MLEAPWTTPTESTDLFERLYERVLLSLHVLSFLQLGVQLVVLLLQRCHLHRLILGAETQQCRVT